MSEKKTAGSTDMSAEKTAGSTVLVTSLQLYSDIGRADYNGQPDISWL